MHRAVFSAMAAVLTGLLALQGCATVPHPAGEATLTVLSFNIWEGGGEPGTERFAHTLSVLRVADADVVGIQESNGNLAALAAAAGYPHFDTQRQLLSRYPIAERLSLARRGGGVAILVPGAGRVIVYNVHFEAEPYGPYELRREKTASVLEVLANEYSANLHVPDTRHVLNQLQAEAPDTPVVWVGDFNVPSHLDWNEASRDFNGGFAVDWPVSRMLEKHGFTDAYRAVHPNPVLRRGLTWTPSRPLEATDEVHDRIDFIYARGNGVTVLDCVILGEPGPFTDIAFDLHPSDHRAVRATLHLGR